MGRPVQPVLALTVACALGVCGLAGCKKEDAQPQVEGDRTLQKLREEVARAQQGHAIGRAPGVAEDPNERLAALAAGEDRPRSLALPEDNATVHAGTLAVKAAGLVTSHSVKAGRLELTSPDLFLGVQLVAQNVGEAQVQADLSLAAVRTKDGVTFTVAQDAQRAGTKELARIWPRDERSEVTLYFEVPQEVVGQGLSLVIPAAAVSGAQKDAVIPLDSER